MLPKDMDNLLRIASTNWFYYSLHGFLGVQRQSGILKSWIILFACWLHLVWVLSALLSSGCITSLAEMTGLWRLVLGLDGVMMIGEQ
jgi:hypothetical protein